MRQPGADHALLKRLKSGDQDALSDLASSYGSKIQQLAFRYLNNREDAEEVAQDVLYKVFRSVGTFRGDAALSSWIYRITFNTAMSRLRTARHQRAQGESRTGAGVESDSNESRRSADWSRMADEHVFRGEMRRRVARAVRELPPLYRAPVVLRDFQGLSTEQASRVLRVPDQTLKSRLHRGRLILRRELADFSGGLTLHHAKAA
jgi:RNA polymerase sigma-70 factor (ECF subfamily)